MSLFCCLNKGNCCEVEEMDPSTGYGAPLPVILSIRSNRNTSMSSQGGGQGHGGGNNVQDNNIPLDSSPSRSPPLFNTPTPIQTPAPPVGYNRGEYESDSHRVSRRVVETSDHPAPMGYNVAHGRMGPGHGLDQERHSRKVQYSGSAAGGGTARNPGHLLEREEKAMTGYNVDHPPESYTGYSGGGWPIGYSSAISGEIWYF